MPNLHPVEKTTREYITDVSTLTGVPYDTVESVVEGIRLLVLHDLFEKGLIDQEEGTIGNKSLDIVVPRMASLILMPINRNKSSEGMDGYTFRGKVHFKESFIQECKSAYYGHHDYLLDSVKTNFSNILIDECKSLI